MNTSVNTNQSTPQKKKGRFNFVDFTLILILALTIGVLIYSFSPISIIKKWTEKDTKNIQYEVEITNVDEDFIDLIKADTPVGDSVTKGSLGTVTMVQSTKYTEYQTVAKTVTDGENTSVKYELVPVEYPNKYNLLITITVSADYYEGTGYTVNSTRIAVGEKLALKFPNFKCEGYCVGITQY